MSYSSKHIYEKYYILIIIFIYNVNIYDNNIKICIVFTHINIKNNVINTIMS